MKHSTIAPDILLHIAIEAVRNDPDHFSALLDRSQVPIYLTDADGFLTYFNPACIFFSGRTPRLGMDRWCVSWRLYTTDWQSLPHDRCPLAVAVREQRLVRGDRAVAERPDGSFVTFTPYPTPLIDEDGRLRGAINMLIDETDPGEQASGLRRQADRCRRMASAVGDPRTAIILQAMARDYDGKAAQALQPPRRFH